MNKCYISAQMPHNSNHLVVKILRTHSGLFSGAVRNGTLSLEGLVGQKSVIYL